MKIKKIIIIIVICVVILLSATIFSIKKFGVLNPFSSCFGLLKIWITDKEYTVVQNYPTKVMFSKTDKEYLDDYMKERGFYILPEEQMGSIIVYSNGVKKEYIHFSTNKFYSKYEWQ